MDEVGYAVWYIQFAIHGIFFGHSVDVAWSLLAEFFFLYETVASGRKLFDAKVPVEKSQKSTAGNCSVTIELFSVQIVYQMMEYRPTAYQAYILRIEGILP